MTKLLLSLLFKAALDQDLVQLADIRAALNRSTINSAESASLSREVDSALIEVAAYCKARGWPPLQSLFVKQPHMVAGVGFFRAMGYDVLDTSERLIYWKGCVTEVYRFFSVGG